jgi:penicillin-binding protein 2
LYGTVNRKHGTAYTAYRGTDYISAGKTGTAQLFSVAQDEEYDEENVADHLKDNAMYIGYAPYDNPELSIAVTVENAGGGGSNAAPVARKVMDYYFSRPQPNELVSIQSVNEILNETRAGAMQ